MQGYAPRSFLDGSIYKTKAAKRSITASHNVSFPKLRQIDLEGNHFFATGQRSIPIDTLLDCLMERCERKAAVRVLRLDHCNLLVSELVERLNQVVVDVIWDGIMQELSDEDGDFSRDSDEEYDSEGNPIDDLYYDYDVFPSRLW